MLLESQSTSSESTTLKVAVLEDDRFAKEGIIAELESSGIEVIGAVGDPEAIKRIVAEYRPHAVIIDLKLGRADQEYQGVDVISTIKQISPDTKCIVVTSFPTITNFRASILAGAEGFIAKENSIQNDLSIGEVVRRVMKGERCYDGELVAQIVVSPSNQADPRIRESSDRARTRDP